MRTGVRCRCGCLVSARVGSEGRCPSCGRRLNQVEEARPVVPPPLPSGGASPSPPTLAPRRGGSSTPLIAAAAVGGGGLALAFGLLLALFFRGGAAPALSTEAIVARSEASIAVVLGPKGLGTGFLVRPGILVTNAHVIQGQPIGTLQVVFPSAPDGREGPLGVRLLEEDVPRDLAVLRVDSSLPPLPLAEGYRFRKGEDVTIIGTPGVGHGEGADVLPNAVTKGVLSTVYRVDDLAFYQLGAAINHGNSGGPVFDSQGRVIGVATAFFKDVQNLGLCVPVDDVVTILRRAAAADERTRAAIEGVHDAAAMRVSP